MNTDRGNHMFNVKLAECLGLYHVISPDTGRFYGHNISHLLSWSCAAALLCVMVVVTIGVCVKVEDNPFNVLLPISVVQNFTFSCLKLFVLTRRSGEIWHCLDVVREDFLSSGGGIRARSELFRRFRYTSVRCSYAILFASLFTLSNVSVPLLFRDLRSTLERPDGTVDSYRYNVFNLIYPVSSDTYNRWFYGFYACETFIAVTFMLISNGFDLVMVPVCLALCCHLESVAREYRSLRHDDGRTTNDLEADFSNNTTSVTLDEIKTIISCHLKVIQKMNDFYKIVRRVILIQIMLSSNTIIFLFYIVMVYMNSAEYRFQGCVNLAGVVYFMIQLMIPCYFFGLVKDTKDSMNFAIYDNNWTEMDIECKKLILLAMNMNNGNDLQMRITPTKIVNMELFKSTIHICYSILSVMVKADIRK